MRISPESWKQTGFYFNYRSIPIFFKEQGKGEPVILLHGFPTSSWDWMKVWGELKQNYRLIAPDFLGFGFSSKPSNVSFSIFEQAHLIESLLKHLDLQSCHIVAHDYGGTVAQELLARSIEDENYPFEFKSISFLNGGLFPESHKPQFIQRILLSKIGPIVSRLLTKKRFGNSFSRIFGENTKPKDFELDGFWSIISADKGHRLSHKLLSYIPEREQNRDRWVNGLINAKRPVQFICGADDPVSGKHMADRYEKLVPNPNISLFEGIGHYPQWEDPYNVARLIIGFLEESIATTE
jgi:pimeloyl-ACP methyl ester carboxylesterase